MRSLCTCLGVRLLQNTPSPSGLRSLSSVPQNSHTNVPQYEGEVTKKPEWVQPESYTIANKTYLTDEWSNLTPKIVANIDRRLLTTPNHPLSLLRGRIEDHFNWKYRTHGNRSPLFSTHEIHDPVVTVWENFDSLLVPKDHVSRKKSDTYYVNKDHVLRAHTSAHQHFLLSSGRDEFLVVGNVFRRDEIDSTHYPIFHQMEGVRLFSAAQLMSEFRVGDVLDIFEKEPDKERRSHKQEQHSVSTAKLLEHSLKTTLEDLVKSLFGPETECRWVECFFPFTHPSWELEVRMGEKWVETLGCGVVEQQILTNAGVGHKVGWAFGIGLERIAMKLYAIPDIRLFWSQDSGFLSQFETDDPSLPITYKAISKCPQCVNDISFWLPVGHEDNFSSTDFYDLVREEGGEMVEQVNLVDEFTHPKTKRISHCYRLVYRHMERTLTQEEVNVIHRKIENRAIGQLGCEIR